MPVFADNGAGNGGGNRLAGLLAVASVLLSCTSSYGVLSDAFDSRDRSWVAVDRMGCLTWNACSAYQLALFEDGEVRWDGSQCVEKWGKRRFRIPHKKAVALFARLAAAGIARLPGSYNDDCSAHLGVTTLYWSRGGERNRTQLVHWQCDPEATNRGFIEAMSMVHDIHETTGTGSWPCENAGRRR